METIKVGQKLLDRAALYLITRGWEIKSPDNGTYHLGKTDGSITHHITFENGNATRIVFVNSNRTWERKDGTE